MRDGVSGADIYTYTRLEAYHMLEGPLYAGEDVHCMVWYKTVSVGVMNAQSASITVDKIIKFCATKG